MWDTPLVNKNDCGLHIAMFASSFFFFFFNMCIYAYIITHIPNMLISCNLIGFDWVYTVVMIYMILLCVCMFNNV